MLPHHTLKRQFLSILTFSLWSHEFNLLTAPVLSLVSSLIHTALLQIHSALGITYPLLLVISKVDVGFYTTFAPLQVANDKLGSTD